MRSLRITLTSLIVLLFCDVISSYGQLPVAIGQWRVHYYFDQLKNLAFANGKVYSSNSTSLFYYDEEDKSHNVISKKDGLTGIDISKLGSYKNKIVLIGYEDGNIDFIDKNSITGFDDIQRASIVGSKRINGFYEFGTKVLVSTDYGLSIIDMNKREVSDSYINVSVDGTTNIFYATVLSKDGDSIFVASEKGLLAAKYNPGVNLSDYTNWKRFNSADGLPTGDVKTIGRLGNTVFAGVNSSGIYYFDGTQWLPTTVAGSQVKSISFGESDMAACVDNRVYKFRSITDYDSYHKDYLYNPTSAIIVPNGDLCGVQSNGGIFYWRPALDYVKAPNGPLYKDVFRLKYLDNMVLNCRGGLNVSYGSVYLDASIMVLDKNDEWSQYTVYDGFPSTVRDVLDVAVHPSSKDWYVTTYGHGLIRLNPETRNYTKLDSTNSPLTLQYTTGAATDEDGTVWICAHAQAERNANKSFLYAIDAKNPSIWNSFKAMQYNGKFPMDIVIDKQSNKWIRIRASGGIVGLMLFKEVNKNTGSSTQIYFGRGESEGALPSQDVNTVDVDKNGQVWIGTSQGICVFTNPAQIKPGNIPKAYLPIVNGFPLFFDKKITCIKTDAANRKWVGTPDGVFLLSADGLETIHHFDKSNSPMISNNILSITINESNGEVFFGTEKGIISYRGDATFGEEFHNDVKIFPNPVERGFDGWVGITGLANNARVKITDIAGKLTYETPSNGGMASWNLKDYKGTRASAGIYLIFSASEDGQEKFVGKLAILD